LSERSAALLAAKAGLLLSATTRSVVALYRPLLAPLNLTHPQYLVLLALDDGDSHTLRSIAQRVYLSDGALSPLLRRLETLGYISARRNDINKRELSVSLTAAGQALLPQLWEIGDTVQAQAGLTAEDSATLRRLLTRLLGTVPALALR
jgi:DNA-binding MarR family transcriptional regulator